MTGAAGGTTAVGAAIGAEGVTAVGVPQLEQKGTPSGSFAPHLRQNI